MEKLNSKFAQNQRRNRKGLLENKTGRRNSSFLLVYDNLAREKQNRCWNLEKAK